ncbi:putative sporulation protein YtxC [Clostridium mediterraneense]|uniref:putative sporulation protein YtxC n=1 Tax=Clostridium mediterraneense TaxID=1805472 RepID=UPI000834A69A|nr:putative sporulation protein YtxC [Clostridium mediterraneense]
MLLVKIAYKEEHNFIRDIQGIKDILKNKDIKIGMSEFIENDTHFIKVFCDDSQYSEEVKSKVILYISNVLYDIIIDNFRKKELLEYLTENYFFLKHSEMLEIDRKVNRVLKQQERILNEDSIYCVNRISAMQSMINDFIQEDYFINIDGFIRFRLRTMLPYIEQIIEKVVESYLVEKEYNEFINLLKYFVDIQDSKIEEVNIFIKNDGAYIIKDKSGNDIFKEFINDLVENKEDKAINPEDIIISGLITNSPKHINIYNRESCSNREFLNTISNVFGERVSFEKTINIL